IQSKSEVVPVLRSFDRLDILDRLAESVLDHPAAAGLAREPVLKRELDTLLAYVVNAREAEYVRSDFATWVVAPVLAVLEQPGGVQRRNAFGHFRGDLPFEENKVPTRFGEAIFDFPRRHLEQCPQTRYLPFPWTPFARTRPDRPHR